MKKAWAKPKLIILVRGTPQEAILDFCVNGDPGPKQPGYRSCQYSTVCDDCEEVPPL